VAACLNTTSEGPAIAWLVVGSVASVLQGCDMEPRDLDVLFRSRDDLARYATRMAQRQCQPVPAILCERFGAGFEWHKVQQTVQGFPVDAVYIASGGGIPDSTKGDGVWEGGPMAWSLARIVSFGELTVAVAPLEIQLESQLRRGRADRAEAIVFALRQRGCDADLLRQCLSREHFAAWAEQCRGGHVAGLEHGASPQPEEGTSGSAALERRLAPGVARR
jgi:hypothetical protein